MFMNIQVVFRNFFLCGSQMEAEEADGIQQKTMRGQDETMSCFVLRFEWNRSVWVQGTTLLSAMFVENVGQ